MVTLVSYQNSSSAQAVPTPEQAPEYTWPFGQNHKTSRRLAGTGILIAAVLSLGWYWFDGEIRCTWWHLWHHNGVEYGGVVFAVPADRYPRPWFNTLQIHSNLGRFRMSRIPVDYGFSVRMDKTGDLQAELDKERKRAVIFRSPIVAERQVMMAGEPLTCAEHSSTSGNNWSWIACFRETPGPVPVFAGEQSHREDFYRWIAEATVPKP
jgi:hypothetical protein